MFAKVLVFTAQLKLYFIETMIYFLRAVTCSSQTAPIYQSPCKQMGEQIFDVCGSQVHCLAYRGSRGRRCILSFSLAPLKQCSDFYFLLFDCCLYIKSTSGKKPPHCSEVRLARIREVSVKHFQSFKSKFLVPVPKVREFFLDAV